MLDCLSSPCPVAHLRLTSPYSSATISPIYLSDATLLRLKGRRGLRYLIRAPPRRSSPLAAEATAYPWHKLRRLQRRPALGRHQRRLSSLAADRQARQARRRWVADWNPSRPLHRGDLLLAALDPCHPQFSLAWLRMHTFPILPQQQLPPWQPATRSNRSLQAHRGIPLRLMARQRGSYARPAGGILLFCKMRPPILVIQFDKCNHHILTQNVPHHL